MRGAVFAAVIASAHAQATHAVDWTIPMASTSLTIDVGDIVDFTWSNREEA